MSRQYDLLITAIAPAIWGSTYIVTTEFLPPNYPLTAAMLRALPAGLLLLLIVRELPSRSWVPKVFALGALNFTIFWALLFVTAYRLPGGVAATLGATQALAVIFLARIALGTPIRILSVTAAALGIFGVGMLILTPNAALDPIGVVAGVVGALSMAAGTVLSRKWRPPVSLLTFTAWQLTAGGLMLVPLAMMFEPALPPLSFSNLAGLTYLGLIGAALTYVLWFRGITRLEPSVISTLGFLSPVSAVVLGWVVLGQALSIGQLFGAAVIIGSVWLSQRSVQSEGHVVPEPFSSTKTRRLAFLSRIKALINGSKSHSPSTNGRNLQGVEQ